MSFAFRFTDEAKGQLADLAKNSSSLKQYKAVQRALGKLQANPRHPGLNTHKFSAMLGPNGKDVFEAYAENNTPGAFRIFWHYGPVKDMITIVAITAHP